MLNSDGPFGAKHAGHTHLFSIVQDFTSSIEPICNCQNSTVPGGKPTRQTWQFMGTVPSFLIAWFLDGKLNRYKGLIDLFKKSPEKCHLYAMSVPLTLVL